MLHNSNYITFKNKDSFAQKPPCHTLPHLAKYDIMKVQKSMTEKLHNLKEVAKILRVSNRSVYRYIHLKKLKANKIGYWRIPDKDLQTFIESNTNTTKRKKKTGKKI